MAGQRVSVLTRRGAGQEGTAASVPRSGRRGARAHRLSPRRPEACGERGPQRHAARVRLAVRGAPEESVPAQTDGDPAGLWPVEIEDAPGAAPGGAAGGGRGSDQPFFAVIAFTSSIASVKRWLRSDRASVLDFWIRSATSRMLPTARS